MFDNTYINGVYIYHIHYILSIYKYAHSKTAISPIHLGIWKLYPIYVHVIEGHFQCRLKSKIGSYID